MTTAGRSATRGTRAVLSAGKLEQLRAALEEQRAFRIDQLAELAAADSAADAATAAVTVALRDGAGYALVEIDAALNRMRTGRYGECLTCRSPIPTERLEILPMAALCAGCQRARAGGGRP